MTPADKQEPEPVLWILGKQIERARNELLLAGRCGDGRFCRACSLPAHELTQQPGCGGPL